MHNDNICWLLENSTLDTPVANYNEASIRYLGATNPSKSFKILQSLTGSDSESGMYIMI